MRPRIVARRAASRCAYCRTKLVAGDVVSCARCGTAYHGACRADLGRCGTMGCVEATPLSPRAGIELGSRSAPRDPPSTRLGLLVAIAMFVGLMLVLALGARVVDRVQRAWQTDRTWNGEMSLGRASGLRDEGRFEDALHLLAAAHPELSNNAQVRLAEELRRDCERLLVLVPGFERRIAAARAFRDASALERIGLELRQARAQRVGDHLRPAAPLFDRLEQRVAQALAELG